MFLVHQDQDNHSEGFIQDKGLRERDLTEEERQKLESDKYTVSEFKHNRLELEAKKNWDLFYRRNKAKFFKDRYWTFREFDELNPDFDHAKSDNTNTSQIKSILEIGCGVGNFVYPLIKQNKEIYAYACDFSHDAIKLLKENTDYDESRLQGFVCDATKKNSLAESLPNGVKVDCVTLIFVLSAIHPNKMRIVCENIAQVLKPGGMILVRDYGLYDHSMIRFQPGHKLDEKFYFRQDGTRTFFFSLDDINKLFLEPFHSQNDGYNTENLYLYEKSISEYVFRETINIKENLKVPRVFIQSKFIRTNISLN